MSESEFTEAPESVAQENGSSPVDAPAGSLAERMQAVRAELQSHRTVILPVTGYSSVIAAEYRALPYPEIRRIISRHQRQPNEALREIYVAADQLIDACVDIHEVNPNDGSYTSLGMTWGPELARYLGFTNVESNWRERPALLAIFEDRDTWLLQHASEWSDWQQGEDVEVDEDVMRDFKRTT